MPGPHGCRTVGRIVAGGSRDACDDETDADRLDSGRTAHGMSRHGHGPAEFHSVALSWRVRSSPPACLRMRLRPRRQGVATAPTCRELERRLDLIKPEAKSTELNLVLFAAADSGCLPLARRLLDAGASLAARDRLGAMALARAARAGHVALVDFLVAQGAPHRRAQSRRRDRALRRGRERAAGQRCGAAGEACRSEPAGPIGRHAACGGRLQGQRSHRRSTHRQRAPIRMSWTRPARRR